MKVVFLSYSISSSLSYIMWGWYNMFFPPFPSISCHLSTHFLPMSCQHSWNLSIFSIAYLFSYIHTLFKTLLNMELFPSCLYYANLLGTPQTPYLNHSCYTSFPIIASLPHHSSIPLVVFHLIQQVRKLCCKFS